MRLNVRISIEYRGVTKEECDSCTLVCKSRKRTSALITKKSSKRRTQESDSSKVSNVARCTESVDVHGEFDWFEGEGEDKDEED